MEWVQKILRRVLFFVLMYGIFSVHIIFDYKTHGFEAFALHTGTQTILSLWAGFFQSDFSWIKRIVGSYKGNLVRFLIYTFGMVIFANIIINYITSTLIIVFSYPHSQSFLSDPIWIAFRDSLITPILYTLMFMFNDDDDDINKRKRLKQELSDKIRDIVDKVTVVHRPQPIPITIRH